MSSETVASKAFAVRSRTVSPTATGRWLPSFFLEAETEGLVIKETMGPGMLPSAMMRNVAWRHRISAGRRPL